MGKYCPHPVPEKHAMTMFFCLSRREQDNVPCPPEAGACGGMACVAFELTATRTDFSRKRA